MRCKGDTDDIGRCLQIFRNDEVFYQFSIQVHYFPEERSLTLIYMQEHMAKHFSLLRYDCPICNKSFSKHGHLNMHMRIHRQVKEYSCIHCKKIFANMNLLRTHVQSHMVQRPYQCGFCGRGFFRPHDKVEHERVHTGEKPYSCSMCGMQFRVRYCLTLHMRRHTGVRPYSCMVCGKSFRTGTAFKVHSKIHLDERAYKYVQFLLSNLILASLVIHLITFCPLHTLFSFECKIVRWVSNYKMKWLRRIDYRDPDSKCLKQTHAHVAVVSQLK
jgi:DNA-directed RNA polymerase subunit RPC12/RpoP